MKKIIFSLILISCLTSVLQPIVSLADTSGGAVGGVDKQLLDELDKANVNGQFSSKDPRLIVADIVKTLLSIVGMIFLVLTIYAGFLWMTAAGDSEKVKSAQGTIKTAVLGLAIVLLSYSITLFITYWLQVATA